MNILKKFKNKSEFCDRQLRLVLEDIYNPRYHITIRNTDETAKRRLFYKLNTSNMTEDMKIDTVAEMIEDMCKAVDFIKKVLKDEASKTLIYLRFNYDKRGVIYGDLEIKGLDKDGKFDASYFLDVSNIYRLHGSNATMFWMNPDYTIKGVFESGNINTYTEDMLFQYKDIPIFQYLIGIRDFLRKTYNTKDIYLRDFIPYYESQQTDESLDNIRELTEKGKKETDDGQLSFFDDDFKDNFFVPKETSQPAQTTQNDEKAVLEENTVENTADEEKAVYDDSNMFRRCVYVSEETMDAFKDLWDKVGNDKDKKAKCKVLIDKAILNEIKRRMICL